MPVLNYKQTNLAAADDNAYVYGRKDGNDGGAVFQITGTWAGTVTFQASLDETNWVSILASNVADGANSATTAANGVFRVVADGLNVRARMTAYTSGTAVVYHMPTRA